MQLGGPCSHLVAARAAASRDGRSRSSGPGNSLRAPARRRGGEERRTAARGSSPSPPGSARLARTVAWSIQCGSGSLWMRWRKPLSFGSARSSLESAERLGRVIGDRARRSPPPIHACSGRLLEHGVGVQVGAGRLHEHGPFDADSLEERSKIRRLEGPPDDRVLLGHPRLRLALEVPEVVMGVDKHRGVMRSWLGSPGRRPRAPRPSSGGR